MGENQKAVYYMYGESFCWASMDTKNRLDDGTTHRRWRGGAGTAASEVATVGITWRTWPSTPGPWRRAARCCSSKSAKARNKEGGERTVFSHGPSMRTRTCAISGTSGSSGLGSVSNEHIDSRTWPTHTRTKRVREQETATTMANTPSHPPHLGDGERRRPLVLEDVEADAAVAIDVAVVDARGEADLGRLEGVIGREVDVQEEDPPGVWRVVRPHDRRLPVEQVVTDRPGAAVRRGVPAQFLQLTLNSLQGHGVVERSGNKEGAGGGGKVSARPSRRGSVDGGRRRDGERFDPSQTTSTRITTHRKGEKATVGETKSTASQCKGDGGQRWTTGWRRARFFERPQATFSEP